MKNRTWAVLICATMALLLGGCATKQREEEGSKNTETSHSSEVVTPNNSNGDSNLENTNISESNSEEPKTNVLYAECEKLDFPETPLTDFEYEIDGNFAEISVWQWSNDFRCAPQNHNIQWEDIQYW